MKRGCGRLLSLFSAVVTALGAAAGAAVADSTTAWSGLSATPNWSSAGNWSAGVPASGASALSFPALSGCPASDSCYTATNDLTGLSVDALSIDDGQPYNVEGNQISIGAGGLTAAPTAVTAIGNLGLPIALSAGQAWSITGTLSLGPVSGSGSPLTVQFNPRHGTPTSLNLDGPFDTGPITATGHGMFDIEPGADLNGNDGNPVTLTHAAEIFMDGSGASGPLTSTAGWLELSTHTLSVSGAANLNGQYGTLIAGPGDAGELTATGNVIVGGRFDLEQLPVNNDCAPLSVGTVYTLISTTGTVSGTFMNVPNGATVPMAIGCPRGQGLTTLARINYTPSAVTATIVAAPTVAELRASLRAVLKPHGRNSRIRRILKNGGYTYTLPPIAGHLVLTWLAKSHRKTVKIASVTADPDGAGPTKLKIVLTSHGRRVLARVSRLKVTGSAFFEPAATAFVALQPRATFTLRR